MEYLMLLFGLLSQKTLEAFYTHVNEKANPKAEIEKIINHARENFIYPSVDMLFGIDVIKDGNMKGTDSMRYIFAGFSHMIAGLMSIDFSYGTMVKMIATSVNVPESFIQKSLTNEKYDKTVGLLNATKTENIKKALIDFGLVFDTTPEDQLLELKNRTVWYNSLLLIGETVNVIYKSGMYHTENLLRAISTSNAFGNMLLDKDKNLATSNFNKAFSGDLASIIDGDLELTGDLMNLDQIVPIGEGEIQQIVDKVKEVASAQIFNERINPVYSSSVDGDIINDEYQSVAAEVEAIINHPSFDGGIRRMLSKVSNKGLNVMKKVASGKFNPLMLTPIGASATIFGAAMRRSGKNKLFGEIYDDAIQVAGDIIKAKSYIDKKIVDQVLFTDEEIVDMLLDLAINRRIVKQINAKVDPISGDIELEYFDADGFRGELIQALEDPLISGGLKDFIKKAGSKVKNTLMKAKAIYDMPLINKVMHTVAPRISQAIDGAIKIGSAINSKIESIKDKIPSNIIDVLKKDTPNDYSDQVVNQLESPLPYIVPQRTESEFNVLDTANQVEWWRNTVKNPNVTDVKTDSKSFDHVDFQQIHEEMKQLPKTNKVIVKKTSLAKANVTQVRKAKGSFNMNLGSSTVSMIHGLGNLIFVCSAKAVNYGFITFEQAKTAEMAYVNIQKDMKYNFMVENDFYSKLKSQYPNIIK